MTDRFATAGLALFLLVAEGNAQQDSVVAESPMCLAVPPGAGELVLTGTTNNNPPTPPADPDFPAETCMARAADAEPVGAVRNHITSDAVLTGNLFESASMHADACLFAPPPTVAARLTITADNGDVLEARIRVVRNPDSPPAPDSEGSGTGVVTGGSGRFAGASGEFNINAKSHGPLIDGTNAAVFRDLAMCGYISLPDAGAAR